VLANYTDFNFFISLWKRAELNQTWIIFQENQSYLIFPKVKVRNKDRNVKFVAKFLLAIIICKNIGELTLEKNHTNVMCAQKHSQQVVIYQRI
jgi:hypothetical protein